MSTTPPPRNAVTSMSFTPFILKTASVPTSGKLCQAAPLDQDLQNELDGSIIEEPQESPDGGNFDYALHFYEYFQSQTKVELPRLSELKHNQDHLYDVNSGCWQPIHIPHILRLRTSSHTENVTTAHAESSPLQCNQNKGHRSLTITRTVEDSSKVPVTEVEEGTYIPKPGAEENKVAAWLNRIVASVGTFGQPSAYSRGLQTRSKTRALADKKRLWSAQFATKPTPTDVDFKMKPDIALLQKDPFDPNSPYSWRDVVSFVELTSSEEGSHLHRQIARKAYAVFVTQPGRRFFIALSISQLKFRLHLFDRAGAVRSRSYSIHHHADYFVRVLCTLAFAPKEFVGYDPTLFFSTVVARSVRLREPATIQVGDVSYIITSLLFSSDSIRGRGTLCFAVKKPGSNKPYVVKTSWVRNGRATTEEQMLNRIKENGLTCGLPALAVSWTVSIGGVADSTALRRPDYVQSHLPEDERPEIRVHRRLLLEPIGIPVENFSCVQELLSVLIDIIDVHEMLVAKCCILHRDISIKNLMMYNFDYRNRHWPTRPDDPDTRELLSRREETLRKRKYRRGLLIDFDYAKFTDVDPVVSEGERTGTIPFMALEILRTFGSRTVVNVTHQPKHDLESVVYVLVWICVLYAGPGTHPLPAHATYLNQWVSCKSRSHIEALFSMKTGDLITYIPTDHFTSYFEVLKPYVRKLYGAIFNDRQHPETSPLTHSLLRNILLDAFFAVDVAPGGSTPGARVRNDLDTKAPVKRKTDGCLKLDSPKRSR